MDCADLFLFCTECSSKVCTETKQKSQCHQACQVRRGGEEGGERDRERDRKREGERDRDRESFLSCCLTSMEAG